MTITTIYDLGLWLQNNRWQDRVVHCHGCFDLIHPGHVRYLQAARRMGDRLVVTVTADRFVGKGKGRPIFTASLRCEVLEALRCVDHAIVSDWPTAVEAIKLIQPDLYVKGPECRDHMSAGFLAEKEIVEALGGSVVFTDGQVWSSTEIIRLLTA